MAGEGLDFIFFIGPRACGKTSVAKALGLRLKGWRVVDLDEAFRRQYVTSGKTQFDLAPEAYDTGCRRLLLELMEKKHVIVALGGGTLVNEREARSVHQEMAAACRKRGRLVLPLPSRFDFRNRSILYQRESARGYGILRRDAFRQFNARIGFYREQADLIVYAATVERAVQQIMNAFSFQPVTP